MHRSDIQKRYIVIDTGFSIHIASFSDFLALDRNGYAASGEDCLTPTPGFFVAGDCRAKAVHQLTTAVADGAVAALAACRWLDR